MTFFILNIFFFWYIKALIKDVKNNFIENSFRHQLGTGIYNSGPMFKTNDSYNLNTSGYGLYGDGVDLPVLTNGFGYGL